MESRKLTITLFIFYVLVLSSFVLFKTRLSFAFLNFRFTFASSDIKRSMNLVPFGAMLILNGAPSYHEVIYNGLVFVPFGIFICMLQKRISFVRLIAPVILTSLLFETIQYIFAIGASDITDVIANTVGGIAGCGIFFTIRRICGEKANKVMNSAALVVAIVFAMLIGMIKFL